MSGARDQVARLLALVPYVQARETVSLQQAARDFGVGPEQIVKDLNVLWFCGLPGLGMGDLIDVDMESLEGEGLIRVSNADYLRRPLKLDSTEAPALIVALRALRESADETVRPIVDRVLTKLEAAAGDGATARVDIRLPENEPEVAHLREQLNSAVQERRRVSFDYYVPARDETAPRTVDPLRVVASQGHTYLEAWSDQAEGQRLFRLDRISAAHVLNERAADHRATPFRDLDAGLFQPSPDDMLATVHLAPPARWVAEYYPVEIAEELPDGGLRIRLRVSDRGWLVRLMLRIGGAAVVENPIDLAEEVRRTAIRALGEYEQLTGTMKSHPR